MSINKLCNKKKKKLAKLAISFHYLKKIAQSYGVNGSVHVCTKNKIKTVINNNNNNDNTGKLT